MQIAEPLPLPPHIVSTDADLLAECDALARATELAVDVESNGLFAYRARLCTIQLAADARVLIVDAIAVSPSALGALASVLGPRGPRKLVHDIAFDARQLRSVGAPLGNVFDTALAARLLGETSTGLASLAASMLGVTISKELQQHDWGKRPLRVGELAYLAEDVRHLPALAAALRAKIEAHPAGADIADALQVETEYRLSTADQLPDEEESLPAWVRIARKNKLERAALAIVRELSTMREALAEQLDRPPFKVVGNDVLVAIAHAAPTDSAALSRVRGLGGPFAGRGAQILEAVARGLGAGDVPDEERARWLTPPPKPPREIIEARRSRESKLLAMRRRLAKERGLDEQVVLPGHCLRELASRDDLAGAREAEALAVVGGIGARRLERDGAQYLACLAGTKSQESAV